MDLLRSFSSELVDLRQLYTHLNCKDDLRWLDPKFTWILPAQVNDLWLMTYFSDFLDESPSRHMSFQNPVVLGS